MTELATVNVRLSDFERCNADLDRLEAENEKLRELVEDAVEAASLDDVRDWSIGHRLRLIRQARELGIEV